MNRALIVGFWKQRAASPFRLALLAFAFGMPLMPALFIPQSGLSMLGDVTGIVLIVAAGAIGQDMSSGVLQLLFARPIRRSEYVLSRWLGAAFAAAAIGGLQVALASVLLWLRHMPPEASVAWTMIGERVLVSFGLCAVIVLFSTLVGSIADIGLWMVASVTGAVAGMAGGPLKAPWLSRIGQEIQDTATPALKLGFLAAGGGAAIPWYAIAAYLSSVVLALALAIVIMNRKELSYASG